MPKRTINTRRNKATATPATPATDDTPATPATPATIDTPATDDTPATIDLTTTATDDTTVSDLNAIDGFLSGDTNSLTIVGIDGTEHTVTFTPDDTDDTPATTPATTPDAVPVTATPAKPDAKAEFLDRKAHATTSALSQYAGASLAVHRSDKQPADSKYIERVASPVQKIGPNGPTARDNSFILAVYDYLSLYFAANYSIGFNPANFGADLGTTSRAASVGYLALTDDGTDIVLTLAGIERGALLSRKRAEAAAKAAK